MNRTIFTTVFIFAFCFAAFAQANESSCQKININAPDNVQQEDNFKVSASFEKESQPSTSKFNWTIIMGNDVSRVSNEGIVEVDSRKFKDGKTIIVLAEALDEKCQNTAMAKIFVVPRCGLAYTIDEYSELSWDDEKVRLDNIAFQMQSFNDMELFAFFNFNTKINQTQRKIYLAKVLNYLSKTRGLEKSRITFLISESESKRTYFQPLPKNFNAEVFDDYFAIRGEDFDKLDKLFQSNKITGNPKKLN